MTPKDKRQDGELSDEQLDGISGGGQDVRKMETIVVTAKRLPPEQKVVQMETITVTASREKPEAGGATVATVGVTKKPGG